VADGHGGVAHVLDRDGGGAVLLHSACGSAAMRNAVLPSRTVLVVDDEEYVRTGLTRVLQGRGYTVLRRRERRRRAGDAA